VEISSDHLDFDFHKVGKTVKIVVMKVIHRLWCMLWEIRDKALIEPAGHAANYSPFTISISQFTVFDSVSRFGRFSDKSKIRENYSSHSGQVFSENLAGVT
jgi:hypothetical protein